MRKPWLALKGHVNILKLTVFAVVLAWLLSQAVLWLEKTQAASTPLMFVLLYGLVVLQLVVVTIQDMVGLIAYIKQFLVKLRIDRPPLRLPRHLFSRFFHALDQVCLCQSHQQLGIMRC
ncbi:MAG: hypothetical protein EA374_03710 [Acholeplasmatales bacterium]|nr:MAG: hypothetical protein EA374_03710 [Acholeplasmatales bacterium]